MDKYYWEGWCGVGEEPNKYSTQQYVRELSVECQVVKTI